MERKQRVSLWEIFKVFAYIGLTGFGGGMAIVSVTERYCVQKKEWLSQQEFMHGLVFGQILGPFSLNTCTFVGYYLRGITGGVVAAVAFIAPSFCLVTVLAWLYFKFHELPQLQSALLGTNPVVIALILVAALGMSKSSVKGANGWVLALLSFAASAFCGLNALTILLLAGVWAVARSFYLREHA